MTGQGSLTVRHEARPDLPDAPDIPASEAPAVAVPDFQVPQTLFASEPPEARGLARDQVRLLVASPAGMTHARFSELPRLLSAGDLVVINNSGTLAAAVAGRRAGGRRSVVHFSTRLDDGTWVVELRPRGRATGPLRDGRAGELVHLPGGAVLTLLAGHPDGGPSSQRLWRARVDVDATRLLAEHGRPIAYGYVRRTWPLRAYQTVFGVQPGSAEMPSAGRPFTQELVTELVVAGIAVAPVTLHTGVSSLDKHEPPLAEPYTVPDSTARLVNATRAAGGRVVAVGTTVTRALETVAGPDGTVTARHGWTSLVLGGSTPARVVDGLITGWHEPGASHLRLLEAVAGADLVAAAYREALREHYLWHEFGDSCLLLPERNTGEFS